MAFVGALPDTPMCVSNVGANSSTFVPLATHNDRSRTWGFGAVMVELSLHAPVIRASPNTADTENQEILDTRVPLSMESGVVCLGREDTRGAHRAITKKSTSAAAGRRACRSA